MRGISNPIESPFAGHIIKAYLTALYVLYRG